MATQQSSSGAQANDTKQDLPILFAPKQGDVRHGISLWVNHERPRVLKPATATSKEVVTNPPHMTGIMSVNGVETPVSAWITKGKYGAFVILNERNKRNPDGSWSNQRLGTGNAMNTEKDNAGTAQPLPANRTPYMVFVIDGKPLVAKASHTAIDYMEELGFLPEVVDNFEALVERKAQERAQAAAQPQPQSAASRVRP